MFRVAGRRARFADVEVAEYFAATRYKFTKLVPLKCERLCRRPSILRNSDPRQTGRA